MGEIIIPFHGGKLVVPHGEAAQAWLEKVLGITAAAISVPTASPRLGEYWEGQGGIYAGLMPTEGGGCAHRIVSVDEAESLTYGGSGKRIEGADSKLDGLGNTRALLADTEDHPAAQWCADYAKDGHHDFYLPAQREISLAWATIAQIFGPHWYWSSTQFSANLAWYQLFGDGIQLTAHETSYGRVRAFRRLEFSL